MTGDLDTMSGVSHSSSQDAAECGGLAETVRVPLSAPSLADAGGQAEVSKCVE